MNTMLSHKNSIESMESVSSGKSVNVSPKEEIPYLRTMLEKLMRKAQRQEHTLQSLAHVPEELGSAREKNASLREELNELK